jgi:hypothetical protein
MKKQVIAALGVVLLLIGGLAACSKAPEQKVEEKGKVSVGPVTLNPHPASLEGKTVVLRWNGKFNGDHLLTRVAELLTERVKGVRVVKMWEVDPKTAVISDGLAPSLAIAGAIAAQKPAIVIASQAD